MTSIINDWHPDAVLAYWVHPDGHAAVQVARLAGAAPPPVIVGGSDVQVITTDPGRKKRVQEVLQSIDTVVTVNQDLKSKVTAMGIDDSKIHAWSQGVDETVYFLGDKSHARKKLGIEQNIPILLWVGRFVPVKGVDILIKACSILHERGIDFRMLLVGEGPLRSELEVDCWRRGLRGKITFLGARPPEQLGDFYRAADLFVMSSRSEGLPNVRRETLACGTPFVSSRVGGIAEIAGDFNRLFPAGDANAMADQIAAMLANPQPVPESMRPITWEQSADKLVEIIKTAQAKPRRPPQAAVQMDTAADDSRGLMTAVASTPHVSWFAGRKGKRFSIA